MSQLVLHARMNAKDAELLRLADSIEDREVLDLARELVKIPSITKKEHEVSDFIFGRLKKWGLNPRQIPVKGYGPDVVAEIGPRNAPAIAFNGHMDTVEVMNGWKHDPFGAKLERGMLFGLGSLDMKSGLAALMVAFRHASESRTRLTSRIVFQAVTGEEDTSAGTRELIGRGFMKRTKAAVVGEGFGGLRAITSGRRGGSYFDIEVVGMAAHGSKPEDGISAVSDAARIICALDEMKLRNVPGLIADDFLPLKESQTVLKVQGGTGTLTVPERCYLKVIRCTVPESKDVGAELARVIRGLNLRSTVSIELETTPGNLFHPYLTRSESPLVTTASKWIKTLTGKAPILVMGRSEADDNLIARDAKVPVICFGPGEAGELARYHQPEEAVHVDQLGNAARAYLTTALDLAT